MFRLAVMCVLMLVASAVAAPIPREDQRPPVPLAGSVWEGDGVVAPTTYEFHPDGRITMSYNGRRHQNIGTWHQDGTRVYWEANNRYCEFEGTLSGTTITGKSWNQPGGNWTLCVKRKNVPEEK
jgi:hypothetical protein